MSKYGLVVLTVAALAAATIGIDTAVPQDERSAASVSTVDALVDTRAQETLASGRKIFRFDTFGDQAFWGDTLRLHEAIAGRANGGVGPGLSPEQALAVGLKVDVNALPPQLRTNLRNDRVDLTSPATTLALLRLNAVVGVRGFFDDSGQRLRSVGITCALCHSDVDDSFAPGIGRRLDGWAARDLDVGQIIALAPNLQPLVDLLAIVHPGIDAADVRAVLRSWGPGKFDAELLLDGKATRPDGKTAATLIPPAFGLAGVNLHTWTGWGSVTHWNAFVANLEMGGQGTFYDPRLNDAVKFPIAAAAGFGDVRKQPGSHQLEARAPARLSAQPACAATEAGKFRVRCRTTRQSPLRGESAMRSMPRAASLHGAGMEHAHAGGDRYRQFPGRSLPG